MKSLLVKVVCALLSGMLSLQNAQADPVNQFSEEKGIWKCLDGSLSISDIYSCDGKIDCPDGSDEDPSQCGTSCLYSCSNSAKCLTEQSFCNGVFDCENGEDEIGCEGCQELCNDDTYRCMAFDSICGNYPDCYDGADEVCGEQEITTTSTNPTTSTTHTTTSAMVPTTESFIPETTFSFTPSQKFIPTPKKLRKCKKNPKKKACAEILPILAANHSQGMVKLCLQKRKKLSKQDKKLCRRWKPVLNLRRKSHPEEFMPKKCNRKPDQDSCVEFHHILAKKISSKTKRKCKRRPNSKRCKKIKVLFDFLANQKDD